MLTEEQLKKIKEHFINQIKNVPEKQREIIKEKINSMNSEEMESFLKENNLDIEKEKEDSPKCIFCSIANKEIKAYILDENEEYMAILELNPLSKGHTLIIPKKHISLEKLPEKTVDYAKKISTLLSKKLNPKEIQFQKNEVLGHATLEIVPVYEDSKLEKKRITEDELIEIYNTIKEKETILEKQEIKPEPPKELPKIKPRIGWI